MTEANSGSLATPLLAGATGDWKLDPAGTTIELATKAMWGLAKVKATFKAVGGGGTVGADGTVSGTLVIDAASIDTKNKKRDNHIRGGDFFEVDKHPTFTYTATGVAPGPDGALKVTGQLTVKGESRPLDLIATATEPAPGLVKLHAEADVDRSKWGVSWAKMGAGLVNHLVVEAQFRR